MLKTKEQLWDLSASELKELIENQERKEEAWLLFEKDQKLLYSRGIYRNHEPVSLEDAFDQTSVHCIYYSCYDDYAHYMEDLERESNQDAFFEYHHILREKNPYWKDCVNTIENALKK